MFCGVCSCTGKRPFQPLQEHIESKGQRLLRFGRTQLHERFVPLLRKRCAGIHDSAHLDQPLVFWSVSGEIHAGALVSFCPQLIQIQPAQHLMTQKESALHGRAELIHI